MSITITGKTMDSDNSTARLCAEVDVQDFFDSENKRWRSGILVTTISNITWTGTKEAGETVHVEVAPPNYDPVCNVKTTYDPLVTDVTTWFIGMNLVHVAAINYGVPDPSVLFEGNGTITLFNADLELPGGTLSSIIPTMTYATVFSEYSPYAPITGSTEYSGALQLGEAGSSDWGMITQDQIADAEGAVIVQFRKLTSSVVEQFPGGTPAPIFTASNVPRPAGRTMYAPTFELPKSEGRTKYFTDYYTYVFAMNAGLIDANATKVVLPTLSKSVYNLCNFGIEKDPGQSPDLAYATLTYSIANDQI